MMMSSRNAASILFVSGILGLSLVDFIPLARAQSSPHLITEPPFEMKVTHPFPSWLAAFETLKNEPTEPPIRDIVPLKIPDIRRTTWSKVRKGISQQVWMMMNYLHTLQVEDLKGGDYRPWENPPNPDAGGGIPTIYPIPLPEYVSSQEYEEYRRLRAKDKSGKPDGRNVRPIEMKEKDEEATRLVMKKKEEESRMAFLQAQKADAEKKDNDDEGDKIQETIDEIVRMAAKAQKLAQASADAGSGPSQSQPSLRGADKAATA